MKLQKLSSDNTNYAEAPYNDYQFELILKDDYECLHFVDWVANIYASITSEREEVRSQLLSAFGSPERELEAVEEEEGKESVDTYTTPQRPKAFHRRNWFSIDRSILSWESAWSNSWERRSKLLPDNHPLIKGVDRYNTP